MLQLFEERRRSRGVSRRVFLTAGALGWSGLTLADILRADSNAEVAGSRKAVVNIHLDGGPPQLDLIDPKPLAPVGIRGEFQPISTAIPGIQISELLPRIARQANQFAFIRALVGSAGRHDAFQCQSGHREKDLKSIGGRPALGCVAAKLQGSSKTPAPTFVDLMQGRPLVRNSARPGFLGPSYQAFRPEISQMFPRELEAGMKNELARQGAGHTTALKLNASLNAARLQDRTSLLSGLDRLRRELDASGMMDAMDLFSQQAADILLSGRFANALDWKQEPQTMIQKYSPPAGSEEGRSVTSEGAGAALKLLLTRRLLEAGVRCVSVSFSDFDTHTKNFPRMRQLAPIVDHALAAFVDDLQQKEMLNDVAIIVWGEFGRTPRIDVKTGGRHHWPRVGMAMMAGGGFHTGQVIGASDRTGGEPESRPVHYKDVFATLYRHLGIDPHRTTIADPAGRPRYLLEEGEVIGELV